MTKKLYIFIVVLSLAFMTPAILHASYDPIVKQAQQYLNNSGYDPGPIDGFLGNKTANAIRAYQRDQGIPETGKLDQATCRKMGITFTQIEKIDKLERVLYEWKELKDPTNAKHRKLSNKIELDVHAGEPTRYAVTDVSGKGIKVANGKFGNRTYSDGMTAVTWVGNRNGEYLDEGFYALLGVGTEIGLSNHWVSIFGIRCKGGKIFIRKDGIKFSSGTTIDRQ